MRPKNYLLGSMLLISCIQIKAQCNPAPVLTIAGSVCPGAELKATFNSSGTLQWKRAETIIATQTVTTTAEVAVVAGGQMTNLGHFGYPNRFVRDAAGNLYIPDYFNHRVIKWAPGATEGTIYAGEKGWGWTEAHLDAPTSVALDSKGNLFICDQGNDRILKWAPGASAGEVVLRNLSTPTGVFIDDRDNLYISEQHASRVVRLAPGSANPVVVAGGNGSGSAANQLSTPTGIFVDAAGNIYVCDTDNNRVQQWAPGASAGVTVAGGNGMGNQLNQLANPLGIYGDGAGTLYISDFTNQRIMVWKRGSTSGTLLVDRFQGSGIKPTGIAVDASGAVYFGDGQSARVFRYTPAQDDATFTATVPGVYTAVITNANGCSAGSNAITILPRQTPEVTITTPATTLCPGAVPTFTANAAEGGTNPVFEWRKNGVPTGGNSPTFTLTDLKGGDAISCVVHASGQCLAAPTDTSNAIVLTLHPTVTPFSLGPDQQVCTGTSATFSAGATATPITWKHGAIGPSITTNSPGVFIAQTTDVCGGSFADTVALLHFAPPPDFLSAEAQVCTTGAVELQGATGFEQYRWSNGASTQKIEVRNPGSYGLQVTDNHGCVYTDSIWVTRIRCGDRIFFPNAFTPDGDGRNDLFRPVLFSSVKQFRFTVYNRWGNVVFQTKEPEKGWDGRVNGKAQRGLFVWTCTYQFTGELLQQAKGTVLLAQ